LLADKHGMTHHPQNEALRLRNLSQLRALNGERFEEQWAAHLAVPIGQVIISALTADVAEQQPAASPDLRPFGLTVRELEVLRLLVEGLSDREIAERLFISPHTVMRHVSSILGKLEVPSRTAAATWAVRHGLT
jgi:DNA-binding NarL/FixJ family response regulator